MAVNFYTEQLALIERLKATIGGIKKVVGSQYLSKTREITPDLPLIAVLPGSVELSQLLSGSVSTASSEYQIVVMLPWVTDDSGSSTTVEAQAGAFMQQIVTALDGWRPSQGASAEFVGINQPVFSEGYAEFALTVRYSLPSY